MMFTLSQGFVSITPIVFTNHLRLECRRRGFSTLQKKSRGSKAGTSFIYAAQTPNDKGGTSDAGYRSNDDEKLQSELNDKIRELFGGSENISIKMDEDDSAEFLVRRGPGGVNVSSYRFAWVNASSVLIAVSAIAGLLFAYLYFSGAVHGSPSPNRRYEMPTYKTRSYIDPYELLDNEAQNL